MAPAKSPRSPSSDSRSSSPRRRSPSPRRTSRRYSPSPRRSPRRRSPSPRRSPRRHSPSPRRSPRRRTPSPRRSPRRRSPSPRQRDEKFSRDGPRGRDDSRDRRNDRRDDRSRSPKRLRTRGRSNDREERKRDDSHKEDKRKQTPVETASSSKKDDNKENEPQEQPAAPVKNKTANILTQDVRSGRTGGVYIPPFKLAQMRREIEDKTSQEYQRTTWDALRKSINGHINKVNVSNIANIIPELFQENLVRGRGLLVRSIMKAQLASPGFTHIYAALVAVINTKLPENGELLLKRVVHRFRRSFKRGDKVVAIALVRFIAHLVNQQVVHELLALEVLWLLIKNPTDDSVEVAVNFTKEVGAMLTEVCPEGLRAIFERFRGILHEGEIDKRVQYTIEGLFAIRKGGFADYPSVHKELDLVDSNDQITHELGLEDEVDVEDKLDVFRFDPDFAKNEKMWAEIKKELLGESDSDDDEDDESSSDDEDSDKEEDKPADASNATVQIHDMSEQDLVNLRRTIYLTIMSSVSHEECAHKLLRLNIRPGQEPEICSMILDCCAQERTYLRYYGLLGQRFCLVQREYQSAFDDSFANQYATIHRLETNKLRNVAKFFAHLLFSDALPWTVFEYIRLNEEETTSSSRIFIKILCQELSEHLGVQKLKERFMDEYMSLTFAGLFPKDNPRNTRFAINFFTSIGLGGLTVDLREHLKNAPKMLMSAAPDDSDSDSSDSDSSSSSSSSSSSTGSSSSGSSSDSSSSDSE
ncbi:hypothetical protein Ae201684P_009975 [Aphanomyces euteiches]|uniref:MI domain-containing protein n=1 Tax=Aphanomyces euteiches TaxID=100861 RepID=A0A6G0WCI9_9STRA|nr:hypothetical protein Ae201684_016400 [Aphanomyces euteiches]KAH9082652.1 hypothetical protein Ae201684P_009975 [Aphanomyces euteiches]